jgi:thiol-disulfide isomerase/thioredoxin
MGVASFLLSGLQNYYKIILLISLVILFSIAGYYVYSRVYLPSRDKRFNDVANTNKQGTIIIYYFFANWCPHCQAAKKDWEQFKTNIDGTMVNGYSIRCVDVDCSSDNGGDAVVYKNKDGTTIDLGIGDQTSNGLIEKYGIEGYPTIKMIKDGVTIDFDSKITTGSLTQFVNTMST